VPAKAGGVVTALEKPASFSSRHAAKGSADAAEAGVAVRFAGLFDRL
jgi:hypothetical protein